MTYLIILAVFAIVLIPLVFVFVGLAVSKSKMSFIEKANQIKEGMTLEEVISIMEKLALLTDINTDGKDFIGQQYSVYYI